MSPLTSAAADTAAQPTADYAADLANSVAEYGGDIADVAVYAGFRGGLATIAKLVVGLHHTGGLDDIAFHNVEALIGATLNLGQQAHAGQARSDRSATPAVPNS